MKDNKIFFVSLLMYSLLALSSQQEYAPVIIVGAGPAGLTTAMELNSNGIGFKVLEATDHILGRVRAKRDFADFPIELGQEYIHGNDHIYYRMARDYESKGLIKMRSAGDFDTLTWVPDLNKMMTFTDLKTTNYKKDLQRLIDFEDDILDYDGDEITIKQYIHDYFGKNQFKEALSTFTSNEKGASEEEIGILGVQEDEMDWGNYVGVDDDVDKYQDYFLEKGAMEDFLKLHFAPVLDRVVLSTPVVSIDYSGDQILVDTLNGTQYICDYLVVAVPLGVLKRRMILFNPELPKNKKEAIEGLGFSGALKINIKFKKPLWPETVFSIFSNGNGKIPLFWVTSGGGRSQKDFILTAFFVGEETYAYENNEDALKTLVIKQLADMFGLSMEQMNQIVIDFFVQNWNKEEYTKGGYSFIRLGYAYKDLRKKYAEPLQKKLFFAGEAASPTYSSCVQGGMETGIEAAQEISDLVNEGGRNNV